MDSDNQQLPAGWTTCTIDELVPVDGVFVDGDWVESKDQDSNGDVRLIQLADVGDGRFVDKSDRFLTKKKAKQLNCTFLQKGDLLVARMPDPLGRSCLFPLDGDEKFVTVVDVCIVRVDDRLNSKFLMHLFNSPAIREQIEGYKSGSTRKRISRKNLARVRLPIPPLNEQYRIVAKIEELFSELDNGIANLNTAHEQLTVYRQSLLKHAFDGRLTAQWRNSEIGKGESNPRLRELATQNELSETDLTKFPPLPDDWTYVTLGQLIDDPRYGTSKKCTYDAKGWGVLRIPNIVSGAIDDSDLKFAHFDDDEAEAFRLRSGDILVIRSNGSVSIVGRAAVVSEREEKYLYAGYLIRIRPDQSLIRPTFLHAVLTSHALRVQIEAKAKSTSGVNNINAQELKSLIVPVCSIEEQDQLLTILSQNLSLADDVGCQIDQQLAKAEALRQAILKKAFSGNLVAQDPRDEPASVLLERIRAEKESNNKQARKKDAA